MYNQPLIENIIYYIFNELILFFLIISIFLYIFMKLITRIISGMFK